jgi:hypothetical protein
VRFWGRVPHQYCHSLAPFTFFLRYAIFLALCLSLCLPACLFVCLCVCLFVCLPVCLPLSVRLPLCPTPSSSSLSSLACRAQCVYVAYFILVVQLSFAAPSSLRAQLSAAAPPRRSTCWHALRKRFAMFLATACAFEVLMTLLSLAV